MRRAVSLPQLSYLFLHTIRSSVQVPSVAAQLVYICRLDYRLTFINIEQPGRNRQSNDSITCHIYTLIKWCNKTEGLSTGLFAQAHNS